MTIQLESRVADLTRRARRLRCPTHKKGSPPARLGTEGATSLSQGDEVAIYPTRAQKEVENMAKATNRVTSKSVASKASKLLSDGRTSARTKSVAASALSQKKR